MEIISAAAGEATKSAIVHVERESGYLIHFKRSTKSLEEKIKVLTATKSDVQARIDAAVRNGESILETVEEWTKRADLVLGEATELSDEASVISSWFRGWCCGRFSLGRKAQKTIEVIQIISEEGSGFGANVSYPKPTQSLNLVGTEDFNAFASRDSTAKEILKAILDDATNLLGVHGMPGVGKTALIKAIAKQVKEEQLFQEVVVVVVSQNPSLIKLQGDIAEALDLSVTGDNLLRRAERLFDRLNQDTKTTLVILDDVWESIKLSEVGIPYKNKGKCCKVVFTTRFGDVCDKIEADTKIEVAVLPEKDSWFLFQQKTGKVEDSSLARDLLNECKGLPLAIVTLGLALRNKDAIVWEDALTQLRKSIYEEGMSYVVSSIKLSYDFLKIKSVKICFLFCCLFPEDHVIKLEELLSYMMGEKLLEDVEKYDEARGRVHSIMDILVSSGLLLRDEDGDIRMHDVVRDVAISISTKEHGFIVKAGRNLSFWPDMELGNCKRLSIMYNPIECLPITPIKAPHLQALFLNGNKKLKELPSDVFAEMKCLMTLDLSHTAIESLPPSLSCLQNLRTLILDCTHLTNVSPVGKLERLEVFSLCGSSPVWEFPEKLGNNLKILDLTGTFIMRELRSNLISKLQRLERLHLLSRDILHSDGVYWRSDVVAYRTDLLREVGLLRQLTSLELIVSDKDWCCHMEIPGPWESLRTFRIRVVSGIDTEMDDSEVETQMDDSAVATQMDDSEVEAKGCFSRIFWLDGIRGKQVANWILVLLGRTYFLKLKGCNDVESFTELGAKGKNHNLKYLSLWGCRKMECLVNNMGLLESNQNAFSNMETLKIKYMGAFVEICKGTPPQITPASNIHRISEPLVLPIFPNLKYIEIKYTKIRYVLPMRVARNLLQLEQLWISSCPNMEILFKYADGDNIKCNQEFKDTTILPRLKKLIINYAPNFKSFTNQNLVMELPSLVSLTMSYCGILARLPFGTTSVPNLNYFDMEQELFDRLEWEDESVKSRFQAILEAQKTVYSRLRAREDESFAKELFNSISGEVSNSEEED